jgi:hypothetical protein
VGINPNANATRAGVLPMPWRPLTGHEPPAALLAAASQPCPADAWRRVGWAATVPRVMTMVSCPAAISAASP